MQSLPHPYRSFALIRALSLFCFGLMVICAGPVSLRAGEETGKREYDLPSGDAGEALKQFSQQSGRGVIANGDLVKGVRTNPVKGAFTPGDALDLMLAGTGLVASQDRKTGAFAVRKETSIEAKNVSRAIAESRERPSKAKNESDGDVRDGVVKLDTFEVFGRKTLNMDIRRTRDDAQPYVIFDREMIQNSGASNLEDFLRTRLTMNTQQGSTATQTVLGGQIATPGSNLSSINLRGLGTNQTLILVDGRRPPSSTGGVIGTQAFNQPDINGIPLASVERIDILPSTAGGIYGGGATGGVINIILRRNYSGIQLAGAYGSTFDGNAASREASLNGSVTSATGSTSLVFGASYKESDPMMQGDRMFRYRAREMSNANLPDTLLIPGRTPNIRSQNPAVLLTLDNGTPLNSIFTSIPTGYAGITSDNGAALVSRAGTYNRLLPEDYSPFGTKSTSYSGSKITSVFLSGRKYFGQHRRFELYADAAWSRNTGESLYNAQATADFGNEITLAPNASNNPFQQAIVVSFPIPNLVPGVSSTASQSTRVTAGAIVRISGKWMLGLDHSTGLATQEWRWANQVRLTPAGQAALMSGALDVMKDLNAFPIDYTAYLTSTPYEGLNEGTDVVSHETTARFTGGFSDFLVKKIAFSGFVQRREEIAKSSILEFPTASSFSYVPERTQLAMSGYLELSLKITEEGDKSSWLRGLGLQVSARHDKYDTDALTPRLVSSLPARDAPLPAFTPYSNESQASTYTIAGKWSPLPSLLFRLSAATGFLQPSAEQITPTILQTQINLAPVANRNALDPKRGNTQVGRDALGNVRTGPFTQTTGGNSNLKPEDSQSLSFGVRLKPEAIPSLRVSLDYTRIKKKNEIFSFTSPQQMLDIEDQLPGRVIRGANLPGDIPGWAGPVIAIDRSLGNMVTSSMEAVDLLVDYSFAFRTSAKIDFYAATTRQFHLKGQIAPNAAELERVGYSNGPLPLKANGGVNFSFGRWAAGVNLQYYARYRAYSSTALSANRDITIARQGSAFIAAQRYVDAYVNYSFPRQAGKILSDVKIGLSVQNVFDTSPPIEVAVLGASRYGDPRLRRFGLSFQKTL